MQHSQVFVGALLLTITQAGLIPTMSPTGIVGSADGDCCPITCGPPAPTTSSTRYPAPCPAAAPPCPCLATSLPAFYDKSQVKAKMGQVMSKGYEVAQLITSKLTAPFDYTAGKVSAMAGSLPDLMAKKGAFVGEALALPIQVGAAVNSEIVNGVTGLVVGIPVGLATGMAAGVVGIKEKLQHSNPIEDFKSNAKYAGGLLMKPIVLVAGGKALLLGKATKLAGMAMDYSGKAIHGAGQSLTQKGLGLKGVGLGLIEKGLHSGQSACAPRCPQQTPMVIVEEGSNPLLNLGDLMAMVPQPVMEAALNLHSELRNLGEVGTNLHETNAKENEYHILDVGRDHFNGTDAGNSTVSVV